MAINKNYQSYIGSLTKAMRLCLIHLGPQHEVTNSLVYCRKKMMAIIMMCSYYSVAYVCSMTALVTQGTSSTFTFSIRFRILYITVNGFSEKTETCSKTEKFGIKSTPTVSISVSLVIFN